MTAEPKTDPVATNADIAEILNASLDGWNAAMGLRFLQASRDEVIAELEITNVHRQPYGVVHGGVYAGMIETVTSVGAAIHALAIGRPVVGLENHTSFLHATRSGKLRVRATPLSRGKRTQVWEGTVTDESGRINATGRVRLLALDNDTVLAGEKVAAHKP
jgi:1,4-dihydroxy-2-naphthoyl-CoA hydrolase